MNQRQTLGAYGEQLAADFLRRQGAEILGRNFRTRWGELDIIAVLGEEIVFCEVRTRFVLSESVRPEETVDAKKVRHLRKAIDVFWQQPAAAFGRFSTSGEPEKFWRLDIISVEVDRAKSAAKIHWFKAIDI